MIVDPEHAEPESVTPPLLVFYEVQFFDEWADGCLIARDEVDIPAPRREIRPHFDLVRLIVGDPPYRSERLQGLTSECGPGGVEDDPVTLGHPAQHVWFAVIGLSETTSYALLDVVAANGVDPVRHASHGMAEHRQRHIDTRSTPSAVDDGVGVDNSVSKSLDGNTCRQAATASDHEFGCVRAGAGGV
jgi:hypothetical protein